jgi:mono/diheme cytochrome c family protein
MRTFGAATLVLVFALTTLVAAQQAPTPRDTTAGVYSTAQVERGRTAFLANCARCHRADLGGQNARPLKDKYFLDHWREMTLDLLFNQIRVNMPPPQARQGEIPDQTYLDIHTYILQGNGLPAGPRELDISQLGSITFVGKDGPQLPPSSSMVHVVACLARISDNRYGLAKSTRPVRTLLTDMQPDERAQAEGWALGSEHYRLQSLDILANFNPDDHLGAKVHAKGYLILQPDQERINLTALEVLDDEQCR